MSVSAAIPTIQDENTAPAKELATQAGELMRKVIAEIPVGQVPKRNITAMLP